MGKDIFTYFGLGCRSVSKIYFPENYRLENFFEAIYDYRDVASNKKYFNNYEYHRALFLLEKIDFLDNNFMMLRKSENISSPVAVMHYEFYKDDNQLKNHIENLQNELQCVVGLPGGIATTAFGLSQSPKLDDFADRVNTLQFLRKLS